MTSKTYKTAQGKVLDLGTIMLRNEHVRAVGNMNVNARGDRLDSENKVIETKPQQIQKRNSRAVKEVSNAVVHTSTAKAKRARQTQAESTDEAVDESTNTELVIETIDNLDNITLVTEPEAIDPADVPPPVGGLAAAIARSKIVKQEKEKTLRELTQSKPGVRKL